MSVDISSDFTQLGPDVEIQVYLPYADGGLDDTVSTVITIPEKKTITEKIIKLLRVGCSFGQKCTNDNKITKTLIGIIKNNLPFHSIWHNTVYMRRPVSLDWVYSNYHITV